MNLLKLSSFLLCLGLMGGCDEGTTTAPPDATDPTPSVLLKWEPSNTTSSVPTYDKSCRFGAATVFESPSNGQPDDTLLLTAGSGAASLKLTITDTTGQILSADATLDRGLAEKSWRKATGTATWSMSGQADTIVDGAICFAEKLAPGDGVLGEVTLVMKAADGSYQSISGGFSLPGAAVRPTAEVAVSAPTIDVDLR